MMSSMAVGAATGALYSPVMVRLPALATEARTAGRAAVAI